MAASRSPGFTESPNLLPPRAVIPGHFLESQDSQPRGHPEFSCWSTPSQSTNSRKQRPPQMVTVRAKITTQGHWLPEGSHPLCQIQDTCPEGGGYRVLGAPAHGSHKHLLPVQQYKIGGTLQGHTSLEKQLLPADPVTSPAFPGQPWPSRVHLGGREEGDQLAMISTWRGLVLSHCSVSHFYPNPFCLFTGRCRSIFPGLALGQC